MHSQAADRTLRDLRRIWIDAEIIPATAVWTALLGGRSNPIWRVDLQDGSRLVCKLFTPNTATPLFANDGTREALALTALVGTDIAPMLLAFQDCSLGETLIYRHIEGQNWRGNITEIAKLMAHLHQQPIPAGLPDVTITTQTLIADGLVMLTSAANDFPQPPAVKEQFTSRRVFLHGDIVPGNILATSDGYKLIDWQCPAIGDPCADIAVFLSPAMQIIYGHRALTKSEIEEFLAVYEQESQDHQSIARYRTLAPLFHWRMAAYCHWKTTKGDRAYAGMAELELAELQQG